jgi:hypothetical protein
MCNTPQVQALLPYPDSNQEDLEQSPLPKSLSSLPSLPPFRGHQYLGSEHGRVTPTPQECNRARKQAAKVWKAIEVVLSLRLRLIRKHKKLLMISRYQELDEVQ